MSDILDRAEAIPEVDMARIVDFGNGKVMVREAEWNALMRAHELLPELIAEIKQLEEEIKRLEEALVEERAMDDAKLPELCDIVHDELMCPALDGDCEHWEGCPRKDEMRKAAREQLRAEGVIR